MRAAAIAAAVFAAFVGVMYLRFSGDAVPSPEPRSSPIVGADGSVCIVSRANPPPDPTPTPVGGEPSRVPCTLSTPRARGAPLAAVEPTPEILQTPTIEAGIPEMLKEMKVLPLQLGPLLDLPRNSAVIVETGCWQCDGGPTGLTRVYYRPDGTIARDSLLDPSALGLPARQFTAPDGTVSEHPPFISGNAITPDASDIVASICIRGTCAPDGLSSWTPDSQTVVFRSVNGGITWTELGRLDVGASVFALLPNGHVLLATYDSNELTVVRSYPGLELVDLPAALGYWSGGTNVLPTGESILRNSNGMPVRPDGSPIISVPPRIKPLYIEEILLEPTQQDGLATMSAHTSGSPVAYLVPFDHTGEIGKGSFAWAGEGVIWRTDMVRLGVDWSKDGLVFGNALVVSDETPTAGHGPVFDYRPMAIDLTKGTIHVLRPFAGPEHRSGRNYVVAIQRGPVVRVVKTEGTCLNIRTEPGAGEVLDCAAEGVLLRHSGDFSYLESGAQPWLEVVTPSGVQGWAAEQYLEYGIPQDY